MLAKETSLSTANGYLDLSLRMSNNDCVTLLHFSSPGMVKLSNNGSFVKMMLPSSVEFSMYVGKSLFLVVIWSGFGGYMSFLLNCDKKPKRNVLTGSTKAALFAIKAGRIAGRNMCEVRFKVKKEVVDGCKCAAHCCGLTGEAYLGSE